MENSSEELFYVIVYDDCSWKDIRIYTDKYTALHGLEQIYRNNKYLYQTHNYHLEIFARNIFGAIIPTYRQME
jgi:hypothetical protein